MTARTESGWDTQPLADELMVWHAYLLRKAGQEIAELAEVALSPLRITLRQFGVLNVVAAEAGLNQRSIGAKMRIDRTTIVNLIDDLEETDLVVRRRGEDRRTFALYLSKRGEQVLAQARVKVQQVHETFLEPLSPQEREMFRSFLLRLLRSSEPALPPA
jgi:DNA-binding MarR family transcriptional regulator